VAPHPQLDEAEDRRFVYLYDRGFPLAEILRQTGPQQRSALQRTPAAEAAARPYVAQS